MSTKELTVLQHIQGHVCWQCLRKAASKTHMLAEGWGHVAAAVKEQNDL